MVSRLLCTLATLACCGAARAQDVDWSHAGGGLFAGVEADRTAASTAHPTRMASSDPLRGLVDAAAEKAGVDRQLLQALVAVESAFQPRAVSPAGAAGLTQLMPRTAADLGVADPFDPADNLAGGAAYLAAQIARFEDVRLALAAYNAGPGRVMAARGVPSIPETQQFVDTVVACVLAQMAGRAVRSARDCAALRPAP